MCLLDNGLIMLMVYLHYPSPHSIPAPRRLQWMSVESDGMIPQIHLYFLRLGIGQRESFHYYAHVVIAAYNDDDAVPLPLGLDFQDFVQIFIDDNSQNKYDKASKVIEQLQ